MCNIFAFIVIAICVACVIRHYLALALFAASDANSEVNARVEGALQRATARIRENGHIDSGLTHRVDTISKNWKTNHPKNVWNILSYHNVVKKIMFQENRV